MMLGDPGEALRAKAQLAISHAVQLREQAEAQREQRAEEARIVAAAKEKFRLDGPVVRCVRCHAEWRSEAIAEATRREPRCLLCGGRLTSVP